MNPGERTRGSENNRKRMKGNGRGDGEGEGKGVQQKWMNREKEM
jgi:hypothetical protein